MHIKYQYQYQINQKFNYAALIWIFYRTTAYLKSKKKLSQNLNLNALGRGGEEESEPKVEILK